MQFIKGMDVSMIKELEARGAFYYINGEREDIFRLLNRSGVNMVRIRIWPDPYDEEGNSYGGGENDLQTTMEIASRTVENNMDFMLDFHYSDFWADPAKQVKPKAWERLNGTELETAVYLHTVNTLKALKNRQLMPKMVQVGNEITKGLLWPDGYVDNLPGMAALLKAGIRGVREECPDAEVVLHLDFGTDNALYRKWFDDLMPYEPDFDVIGMSYYPHWNGSLSRLLQNMNDISERYKKGVLVAETSIRYLSSRIAFLNGKIALPCRVVDGFAVDGFRVNVVGYPVLAVGVVKSGGEDSEGSALEVELRARCVLLGARVASHPGLHMGKRERQQVYAGQGGGGKCHGESGAV